MTPGIIRLTIYRLLLALAHFLYAGYLMCGNLCTKIKGFVPVTVLTPEEIRRDVVTLKKVPLHLVVILGLEEPSYVDLANIIIWSIASGIPFISFYDHNGLLKKTEEQLIKVVMHNSGLKYENGVLNNGCQNGMSRRIKLKVFDGKDGRQCLVELTRLCCIIKSSKIDQNFVDNCAKESLEEIPDPELALICGEMCATYGFLPWQVRVTEFVNISTHHGFTFDKFKSSLEFYGKCEQRFGK